MITGRPRALAKLRERTREKLAVRIFEQRPVAARSHKGCLCE